MTYVLACGGRDYTNSPRVYEVLDTIHKETPISLLITGGARGADTLADQWAKDRGVNRCIFPANWKAKGNGAGPARNAMMLYVGKPTLVVAFPGGSGTRDMIRRSLIERQERGLPIVREFDDVRELPILEAD